MELLQIPSSLGLYGEPSKSARVTDGRGIMGSRSQRIQGIEIPPTPRYAAAWQGESEPGGTYGLWVVVERVTDDGGFISLPGRYATREAALAEAKRLNLE